MSKGRTPVPNEDPPPELEVGATTDEAPGREGGPHQTGPIRVGSPETRGPADDWLGGQQTPVTHMGGADLYNPAPQLGRSAALRDRAQALVGTLVDNRYEIDGLLGEGGMGLVFSVTHISLNKRLALKVLRPDISRDAEVIQRFRQEAQSASAIGNRHIIDISDFGTLEDGSTYFVMEFLDGEDLTRAIRQSVQMPEARVLKIAAQLSKALAAAHKAGIIHRDLKPDNVYLIESDGQPDFVKVLDFGIAKVSGTDSQLTKAGQIFGTPDYMSPEQCAGGDIDIRSDIYALGVIMYEMTCGKPPFAASNLMGVLTQQMYQAPEPPRQRCPDLEISDKVEAIILRCMSKEADQRYQTMEELAADIMAVRKGMATASLSATLAGVDSYLIVPPQGLISQVPPPPQSTNRLLILVVLVLGAIALALAFPRFGGPDDTADSPATLVRDQIAGVGTGERPDRRPAAVDQIEITSEPSGASITNEGNLLGTTPARIGRPTGAEDEFTVNIALSGYQTESLVVSRRSAETLRVPLRPIEPGASTAEGRSGERPSTRRRPRTPRPATRDLTMMGQASMSREILNPWAP